MSQLRWMFLHFKVIPCPSPKLLPLLKAYSERRPSPSLLRFYLEFKNELMTKDTLKKLYAAVLNQRIYRKKYDCRHGAGY